MKRLICNIWTLLLLATIFTGCSESDDTFYNRGAVRVDLAFTLSGPASNKTRMADDVVQISEARNYDILSIIPMIGTTPDIQSFSNETPVDKPSSTNPTAQFYHYGNCDMSAGVNKCIVYAKADAVSAPSGVSSEAHNGSLAATFPSQLSSTTDITTEISFSPVSMLANENIGDNPGSNPETPGDYDAAWALANYLTNIANASVEVTGATYDWRDNDNSTLKILFQNFTNNVNNASTGQVLAGSATNVKKWASLLKSALESQSFTVRTIAQYLKERILTLIGDPNSIITSTYPRNYDLPDGAAVLQWVETTHSFVPQTQTTTLANINSISRYVYPPELYYFVESDIRCKESQVDYQTLYDNSEITTWANFLSEAKFVNANPADDITAVTGTTKAVALKDPVQYAVARLNVTIQAGGTTVKDANNDDITIGTNNFPLTGIIVGNQRPVNYAFNPTTDDDISTKFIYDSQLMTNYDSDTERYDYYYLTSDEPGEGAGPSTLVLQSNDAEDVVIALEFQNNSETEFYGVNNEIIYPGTRFYLVGTIPYKEGEGGDDISKGRVFTKAYTTVVKLKVNSLAGAYNVLPNILSNHLEVGVEVMTKWIAAEPTTVVLQ